MLEKNPTKSILTGWCCLLANIKPQHPVKTWCGVSNYSIFSYKFNEMLEQNPTKSILTGWCCLLADNKPHHPVKMSCGVSN